MNPAIFQYFDRAAWALHNATNDALKPNVKSHLIALGLHACQSLKEALDQVVGEESNGDKHLAAAIKNLPHVELIQNIRNMDLHGWPIPVCDPRVQMVEMVSKPGHPVELSSSHGVCVSMQMDGLKPRVHRTPKDMKHGTVTFGGATVSCGCSEGKLIVHDFSTGKDYLLLRVLRSFLERCQPLIADPTSGTSAPAEQPSQSTEPNGTLPSITAPP
jgi:hypothetical protein